MSDTEDTPHAAPDAADAPVPAITLAEALALLGVETLRGLDGPGQDEFLEGMTRMRQDMGEEWVRENREDLLALWAAMLEVRVADDPAL